MISRQALLLQVVRAVRKLVKYAVGTAVNKSTLDQATQELVSRAAKVQWKDVNGPGLLTAGPNVRST
eukprot:1659782-Amphidinium_carterae.1